MLIAGRAFGVPFVIRTTPTLEESIRSQMPPSWTETEADPLAPVFEVAASEEVRLTLSSLELYVAEHARRLIFLHAGAVAVEGLGVVLPGRSMTGKSSLVAALVRAGAEYYSDEYAILNDSGFLVPYPRDVQLRSLTEVARVTRVSPSDLGRIGSTPVPIAIVAHLQYGGEWDVRELSPARCVLAMMDNAVAAQTRTPDVLQRCASVAETARGITGSRGDAHAAASNLLALIRAPRP